MNTAVVQIYLTWSFMSLHAGAPYMVVKRMTTLFVLATESNFLCHRFLQVSSEMSKRSPCYGEQKDGTRLHVSAVEGASCWVLSFVFFLV